MLDVDEWKERFNVKNTHTAVDHPGDRRFKIKIRLIKLFFILTINRKPKLHCGIIDPGIHGGV